MRKQSGVEKEMGRISIDQMQGLRKILRVTRTAKKTNEWVLNKTVVKRKLLDTVKARKLAYRGHTMRKKDKCKEQCQVHEGEEDF